MSIYKDVSSLELVTYTVPEDGTFADGVDYILEKLDAIPKEDVEPVRHGKWIFIKEEKCAFCTACKQKVNPYLYGYGYCGMCGARMDGKGSE